MRLAWLTDLHLDFLTPSQLDDFLATLASASADAFVITGDIGQARVLVQYLKAIGDTVMRPVYFVLGNHDYYYSSVAEVRRRIAELCERHGHLIYLSTGGPIELAPGAALIGHDGWADLQYGDFATSRVLLNDYLLISELKHETKAGLERVTGQFARQAADHFYAVLTEAASRYAQVYIATHVPPFRESCWHQGRISDEQWLPHFTCKASGEAVRSVMQQNPGCHATILCGHTHGGGTAQILGNLQVLTGEAHYGRPAIQMTLEISGK